MAEKIYLYHTSPNQRMVVTQKTQSDKEHTYAIVNLKALFTAARELTDKAFKLYSRLNMHSNEYAYALSPVEIQKTTGMSEDRYRRAVKELIKKGYLVQSAGQKNLFTFYEYPARDAPSISVKEMDQAPETTVSSGEITQIIQEKPLPQPGRNQGRNTTDITSHNTWDNTVNNTRNNTRPRSNHFSVIDEMAECISGNPLKSQNMGNYSGVLGNAGKKPDIHSIVDWDDPNLPF